jgi:cell division protein FtsW
LEKNEEKTVLPEGLSNCHRRFPLKPEAHTDFILPIIGEELGLIATLAVVVAFCVLGVCGLLLASQARDLFGRLLVSGIVMVIGVQAVIDIAVVTNTIPNKGMALPFISYGGSNLLMTLAAVGVVLNVFGGNPPATDDKGLLRSTPASRNG